MVDVFAAVVGVKAQDIERELGQHLFDHREREQVTQDIRRRVAACFVALADGQRIAGYYTLASASSTG